jgi:pimeloyl-ACP methyl ester carboxylesterase
MTKARRLTTTNLPAATALLLAACSFVPPPAFPRPAVPLAVVAEPIGPVELVDLADDGAGTRTGALTDGHELVAFELRSRPAARTRPRVLLVPILAGGQELMRLVGDRLLERGFDVASCARVEAALKPPQRGADIDRLFRRSVRHQRILLRWLADHDPAPVTHVLGLSMGGMLATAVAAEEPGLAGVGICLSGGDFASLVFASGEPRVHAWLEWRRRHDGLGDDGLRWELGQFLRSDPLVYARAVATERVFMVSATFDAVVPSRHRDLLWEALGRPQRVDVPLGHYSAALALDPVVAAVAGHFAAREAAAASVALR